jgi:hypothetical protein
MQHNKRLPWSLLFLTFLTLPPVVGSQVQPPASDAQAISLAQQAIEAMTHGVTVKDVTLTGTATLPSGSAPHNGKVTLTASGSAKSRLDIVLPEGTRTEVRNSSTGMPQGKWTSPDRSSGMFATQNCWTDPVWFFPALSSLSTSDPSVIFHYVGSETRGEFSVQHIQVYRSVTGVDPAIASEIQRLSITDFFLESKSALPIEVDFNVHPDDESGTNISMVVIFSAYQTISGVQLPTRILQYVNNSPVIDMTVASASVNAGVSDYLFSIE